MVGIHRPALFKQWCSYGNLSGGVSWPHQSAPGLREVASATSVSAVTLTRLEQSEIPDMSTFLVVLGWAGQTGLPGLFCAVRPGA